MLRLMGWLRNIGRVAAGFGSLSLCGVGHAEAGEPLVIAKLADPEAQLVTTNDVDDEAGVDRQNADFINALRAASAERQRSVDLQCRTAAVPKEVKARLQWEANCRYQRR